MSFDTYFSKTFQGICMERRDRDPGFSLVVARFVNFKFSLRRRYQVVQFLDCTIGWLGPSSTMNKSMIRSKRYKELPTSWWYRSYIPSLQVRTAQLSTKYTGGWHGKNLHSTSTWPPWARGWHPTTHDGMSLLRVIHNYSKTNARRSRGHGDGGHRYDQCCLFFVLFFTAQGLEHLASRSECCTRRSSWGSAPRLGLAKRERKVRLERISRNSFS